MDLVTILPTHFIPYVNTLKADGQKLFLAYLHFFNLIFFLKKGMHWLGPGSKIGLNEMLGKFKET